MSNIIKSLRRWLQQGNHSTWAVFCLFTLLLFAKQLIFHWDAFHARQFAMEKPYRILQVLYG